MIITITWDETLTQSNSSDTHGQETQSESNRQAQALKGTGLHHYRAVKEMLTWTASGLRGHFVRTSCVWADKNMKHLFVESYGGVFSSI